MSNPEYHAFLERKRPKAKPSGFHVDLGEINKNAFEYQKETIQWLLVQGRAAAFLETGMGKTLIQLEWLRHVWNRTKKPVLLLCPLAVARQTIREHAKFSVDCPIRFVENQSDVGPGINVTNYHKLHHFDVSVFGGVGLDESSILKSYMGKTKRLLVDVFQNTEFLLACSATPAPNDHMELGNHSEFLRVMNSNEMMARWFIKDQMDATSWRLKNHGVEDFWRWVSSWAVCAEFASDLGHPEEDFQKPGINEEIINVSVNHDPAKTGSLFPETKVSSTDIHKTMRVSTAQRVAKAAEIANSIDGPVIVWCERNDESALLTKAINGAVEVKGSDSDEVKERNLIGFSDGTHRVIVTKPKIAGFGMNWQHCHHMIFTTPTFSYESRYQAISRCNRYGQEKTVNVYTLTTDSVENVMRTLERKRLAHEQMKSAMRSANFKKSEALVKQIREAYEPTRKIQLPSWLTK